MFKGYTERKFRTVTVGMTAAEVQAILGPPIKRMPWGILPEVWLYTDHKTITGNFWRRWIAFDVDSGRVEEVIADFWFA